MGAGECVGETPTLFHQAGSWPRCSCRMLLTEAQYAQLSTALPRGSFLATVGLHSAGVSLGAAGWHVGGADCVVLMGRRAARVIAVGD